MIRTFPLLNHNGIAAMLDGVFSCDALQQIFLRCSRATAMATGYGETNRWQPDFVYLNDEILAQEHIQNTLLRAHVISQEPFIETNKSETHLDSQIVVPKKKQRYVSHTCLQSRAARHHSPLKYHRRINICIFTHTHP